MSRKKIVLVIGSLSDQVVKHFEAFLRSRGVRAQYIFVYEEWFGRWVHVDDQGWLVKGQVIKHSQIVGVLNRLVALRKHEPAGSVYNNIVLFCNYLLDEVYPIVLNKPKHGMSNYSKLYQLVQVQNSILRKPQSELLMNHFCDTTQKKGAWIFKSASSVRSRVAMLSRESKTGFVWEPVLFQPYVEGVNVRVHVVGDKYVAHGCDSNAVDYRYAKTTIHTCLLPPQVATSCIAITRQLKLQFSGIDLIQTKKGWVLLEVNTAPGFSYFEGDGGGVSALLHQHLSKEVALMQKLKE